MFPDRKKSCHSRLPVVAAERDHAVAVARGEVRESHSAREDVRNGRCEKRSDFGPDTGRTEYTPVLRHVRRDRDVLEAFRDGTPI